MDCVKHRSRLLEFLDNQLGPLARWRLQKHVQRCRSCRQELAILRKTVEEVKQLAPPSESQFFWGNFHKRVMASLPPEPRRWPPRRRYVRRLVPAVATAVAALALVLVLKGPTTPDRWVAEDWSGEDFVAVAPWHELSDEELSFLLEEMEEEQTWPSEVGSAISSGTDQTGAWEAIDRLRTDELLEVLEVLESEPGKMPA
jgi:hypothetical protein